MGFIRHVLRHVLRAYKKWPTKSRIRKHFFRYWDYDPSHMEVIHRRPVWRFWYWTYYLFFKLMRYMPHKVIENVERIDARKQILVSNLVDRGMYSKGKVKLPSEETLHEMEAVQAFIKQGEK